MLQVCTLLVEKSSLKGKYSKTALEYLWDKIVRRSASFCFYICMKLDFDRGE